MAARDGCLARHTLWEFGPYADDVDFALSSREPLSPIPWAGASLAPALFMPLSFRDFSLCRTFVPNLLQVKEASGSLHCPYLLPRLIP